MSKEFVLTKELNHLAVIMDGNGRWAKKRLMPRTFGHKEGCKRVGEIFSLCMKYNIKVFSLFAFSTENWNRPEEEIELLFEYLEDFFDEHIEEFINQGVKIRHMGDSSKLPLSTQKVLAKAIKLTESNDKFVFNICLNYGSKQEIVKACKNIALAIENKEINANDIDEKLFENYLDSHDLPMVDLLIRTSGENRLSNFLLYQLAYAEFIFTPTYWPDFKEKEFINCLKEYSSRERRYGKIKE
jgi:undecaprenyl diphosphate synthase